MGLSELAVRLPAADVHDRVARADRHTRDAGEGGPPGVAVREGCLRPNGLQTDDGRLWLRLLYLYDNYNNETK